MIEAVQEFMSEPVNVMIFILSGMVIVAAQIIHLWCLLRDLRQPRVDDMRDFTKARNDPERAARDVH